MQDNKASFYRLRLSAHTCKSAFDTFPFNSFPSFISAVSETLTFSPSSVFPNPLPPEVANSMILFPEKCQHTRFAVICTCRTVRHLPAPATHCCCSRRELLPPDGKTSCPVQPHASASPLREC